jgi:hypothetical protein
MADLDKLTAAFPRAAIKQRAVQGRQFDYVEGHTVIHRLNDATENQWSMEIKSISTIDIKEDWKQVTAHVALTIPGLGTREHIGIQDVHVKGPDLVKGAITDALKKAATLFGVGLELYGPDYENGEFAAPQRPNPPAAERRTNDARAPVNAPRDAGFAPQGQERPAPGPGMATEAQVRNLHRLGKKLGWTENDYKRELHEAWDVDSSNALTKKQASDWISVLMEAAGEEVARPQQEPSFGGMAGPASQSPALSNPPEWLAEPAELGEPGNDQYSH